MTQEQFALETSEISKHFGAVKAVDELSISIPRKGMTSIVGPNGSGKSTLINLLSGTLPLDGGLVIVNGVGLQVVKAHETPAYGITRTFQEVRLFDQITVWDNILVVLTNRRVFPALMERSKQSHRDKARSILESVGMWGKARLAGDGAIIRAAEIAGDRARAGAGCEHLPVRRAIRGTVSADAGDNQGHYEAGSRRGTHRHICFAQYGHRAGTVRPPNRARQRQAARGGGCGGCADARRGYRGLSGDIEIADGYSESG